MVDSGVKNSGEQIVLGVVDEWENLSGNIDFIEIVVGNGLLIFISSGINYNFVVYFDGMDDRFQKNGFDVDVFFSSQNNIFFFVFEMNIEVGIDVFCGWELDVSGDCVVYFENVVSG